MSDEYCSACSVSYGWHSVYYSAYVYYSYSCYVAYCFSLSSYHFGYYSLSCSFV